MGFLTALFTLPEGAVSNSVAYIGQLFESVGDLVWVAIGIPLAFFVIKGVIGLIPKGRSRRA